MERRLYRPPFVLQKNFIQRKKFWFKDGWIYVYAQVNKSDSLEFMIDSGSPSFIGFSTKKQLNIHSHKVEDSLEYCSLNVQLGNIDYQDATFMILETFNIKQLLGANLMQNQIWSLNFADSVLTITDNIANIKADTAGYRVHYKPYGKQKSPLISLKLNTDSTDAFLDLGDASSINLYKGFNLTKEEKNNPDRIAPFYYKKEEKQKGKDSIAESYYLKLNSLKIGNYETKNVLASYSPGVPSKNLIGLGFLKNFIVTIDAIHHTIYLKPIEGRIPQSNIATYGLDIYRKHKSWVVGSVFKGSEAEKQGINCNDEIDQINGKDVKNIDARIIKEIDNREPSDKELTLRMKNKPKDVILRKYLLF